MRGSANLTDDQLIDEVARACDESSPLSKASRGAALMRIAPELASRLKAANEQLAHDRAHTRFYDLFYEHVKNENGGSMCEKDCDPSVGVHLCEICWPEGYDSCEDDVI